MATPFDFLGLQGQARKLSRAQYSDQQMVIPSFNEGGEVLVAQSLPERTELVRLGSSWGAQIATGNAFTFVANWPTTRAELVLWNGEPAGGRTYVIDRVWLANVTSQAAAQPYSLLAQLAPSSLSIAAPTDNAAVLRQSLSGSKKTYDGLGRLMVANTAFALANLWVPLGPAVMSPMTTNLGASMEANVRGKYLVPPGAAFCLAGLAGTAAGTAIAGIEWHEVFMSTR